MTLNVAGHQTADKLWSAVALSAIIIHVNMNNYH